MKQLDVSIIFVYYNTPREIIDAVKSIKPAIGKYSYEVIIIDNGSIEKKSDKIFSREKVIYKKNDNVGYGAGLNIGARLAKGRFFLLVNPDLVFEKNSISLMVKKMENDSSIGIIGPAFLDQKGRIRKVGNDMPFFPQAILALSAFNKKFPNNYFSNKYFIKDFDRKNEREIPVLCGACMLVRSDTFKKIKGFDKRFFMYFEEADICYRIIKLGLRVYYLPEARVTHYVGGSTNNLVWIEKTYEHSRFEFFKKYYGTLVGSLFEGIIRLINLPARLT